MLIRFPFFLAALAEFALADVKFTSPAAGASIPAKNPISIKWTDSGDQPPLSSLTTYTLFLCAGGNDPTSQIQTGFGKSGSVSFSAGSTVSDTVDPRFGDSVDDAYFFKIISIAAGGTVTNYSPRFSLEGMTQPFPPNVLTGIKKAGTASPPTENNVVDDPGAGANAPAGSFAIPYASQSGLTFYAPMQGRPGTKITAKTASPRYPTSSVQIASTYLPTPNQKTTMTLSMTFSTDSHAHTASPAAQPQDDMQKYLARWKD